MEYAQPIIRTRSEHPISRRDIDPDALTVLNRLSREGYTAYLVGGGVRDLLRGARPKDFDISTDAHPQQIKKLFRNCFLIGRRFRLAHVRFGQKVIETSTFRRSPRHDEEDLAEDADLLQHRDNTFGTPEEDAYRRDFTINGLFYDIRTFRVLDYVGGLQDLDRRVIRAIGDPEIRFREDPVRMIRAVRFASRLGFAIEPATYGAIRRLHAEIQKSAPARLQEEVCRLFGYRVSEKAFLLLNETGLLEDLFPGIAAHLAQTPGDRQLFWKCLRAFDECEPPSGACPPSLLWAVLAYPVFDACVSSNPHAHLHEVSMACAHEAIVCVGGRVAPSRRATTEAVHMLVALSRFTSPESDNSPSRKAARIRFMRNELFPAALALWEVVTVAGGGSMDQVHRWRRDAAEAALAGPPLPFHVRHDTPAHVGGSAPSRPWRPRFRRGRRGRREGSTGSSPVASHRHPAATEFPQPLS